MEIKNLNLRLKDVENTKLVLFVPTLIKKNLKFINLRKEAYIKICEEHHLEFFSILKVREKSFMLPIYNELVI
jgi:hypothetical protein